MINHILIPLDGSSLAECVLPHVLTIARGANAHITLLHVLELPPTIDKQAVDPLAWHLRKQEMEEYLHAIATKLQAKDLKVDYVMMEGSPAEFVIDFANHNEVDLIALSSHGRSGLSRWNISSVVQKIILRSFKSILLVRAYLLSSQTELEEAHYKRLFIGLDLSTRAEYILPVAISLAQHFNAELILGMVIRRPEMLHRFPLSEEDEGLIQKIADRNYREASHYFEQLTSRISLQGIRMQTRLEVSENISAALHNMVEQENPDLVMLVAHGRSSKGRWPYGSIAASFIAYGTTSLMIMQDLSGDEIERTQAEMAAHEIKGH